MNVDDIKKQVDAIRATSMDDERAHSEEDSLHQSILAAIAAGECDDPAACAKAGLETLNIMFCRWCA